MKWTEVAVKFEQGLEELITNKLYTMEIEGLAVEDPRHIESLEQRPEDWDYIDEELIQKKLESIKDDRITIKVYFSEDEIVEDKIAEIKELLRDVVVEEKPIEVTTNNVESKDWSENWKKYYKTTRVGEKLIIKPSWEEYEELDGDIVVELDPGMAFGTGTHETTSMCAEAIEKYITSKDKLLDIGTGSGILSIIAAKFGAKTVLGVDLDDDAVRVAKENVEKNSVEDIVEIREGDLFKMIEGKSDIIVANIMAEIIAGMCYDVKKYLKDKGIFISSGIILERIGLVENALLDAGFEVLEINRKNEWACIVAKNGRN